MADTVEKDTVEIVLLLSENSRNCYNIIMAKLGDKKQRRPSSKSSGSKPRLSLGKIKKKSISKVRVYAGLGGGSCCHCGHCGY
jgi:hypothetical protein